MHICSCLQERVWRLFVLHYTCICVASCVYSNFINNTNDFFFGKNNSEPFELERVWWCARCLGWEFVSRTHCTCPSERRCVSWLEPDPSLQSSDIFVNSIWNWNEYTLCLKKRHTVAFDLLYNLDVHNPITKSFGRSVTKKLTNQTMPCFPTSPI